MHARACGPLPSAPAIPPHAPAFEHRFHDVSLFFIAVYPPFRFVAGGEDHRLTHGLPEQSVNALWQTMAIGGDGIFNPECIFHNVCFACVRVRVCACARMRIFSSVYTALCCIGCNVSWYFQLCVYSIVYVLCTGDFTSMCIVLCIGIVKFCEFMDTPHLADNRDWGGGCSFFLLLLPFAVLSFQDAN